MLNRYALSALIVIAGLLFGGAVAQGQAPTSTPPAPTLTHTPAPTRTPAPTPLPVEVFDLEVIATWPHDTAAYTQGLLLHEGMLYESTGLRGQSSLRMVDPETGEVLRQRDIPIPYFAEGLALVDDRLIQITWQEGVAFVYDLATFDLLETFNYTGEGWGLCYDGSDLYMSDGSEIITRRDPQTFEALETIRVTYNGQPVVRLNELECVDDVIFANIWFSDFIVRIDKATGQVTGVIDAQGLLPDAERAALTGGAVLNGIAYDPEADVFLITGKLWPRLFVVRLVPRQE
jgi:glutamine cyclotransferase